MAGVLVLNATFEPLAVVSTRRAVCPAGQRSIIARAEPARVQSGKTLAAGFHAPILWPMRMSHASKAAAAFAQDPSGR